MHFTLILHAFTIILQSFTYILQVLYMHFTRISHAFYMHSHTFYTGKSFISPMGGLGAPKPAANWGAGKGTPRTARGTAPGAAKRAESITNDQKLVWLRKLGVHLGST